MKNIGEWWLSSGFRGCSHKFLRRTQTLTPWQDPKQESCSSAMEVWDGSVWWMGQNEGSNCLNLTNGNLGIDGTSTPRPSPPALWGFSERSHSSTTLPRPPKVGRGGISWNILLWSFRIRWVLLVEQRSQIKVKQIGVTKHVRFCTLAVLDLRNSADPHFYDDWRPGRSG